MCDIKDCAFLILAGGKSRRMGKDKAGLLIGEETFLEHMIRIGKNMGFSDILVSGDVRRYIREEFLENVRLILDVLNDRGPLGGLYSCFLNTDRQACFVISVDVPLISPATIQKLVDAHDADSGENTLLCHKEKTEPLIGVFNTRNTEELYELIQEKSVSVFTYLRKMGYSEIELTEPLQTISNINTPEEYTKLNNTYL